MARKTEYPAAPAVNYEEVMLPVGILTSAFANLHGPQRNRPADSVRWQASLRARSRAYGDYNPVLLRPRVVSYREDTRQYYTLDGNSSNHWLQAKFGPNVLVPCRVLRGLTPAQENRVFQELQKLKRVTPLEAARADVEFDAGSAAFVINKAYEENGFTLGNRTDSAHVLSITAGQYVLSIGGEARLREVLRAIRESFPDDDSRRTNASLVKAIALALGNAEMDREVLLRAMKAAGTWELAGAIQGRGSEGAVLARIRAAYDALAQQEDYDALVAREALDKD
jgi:hypothetical protein